MKTQIQQTITFSAFNEQMARRLFGLKQELKQNLLEEWEQKAEVTDITVEEQKTLDRLQAKLTLFVRSWNEEELKLKFIGPLIELVNFDDYELEVVAFSERPMGIVFPKAKIEVKGVVDLMVARGISHPEQPFFFIHEYKREKDNSGDPLGQLLSTMFVAKELNKRVKPLTLFRTAEEQQKLTNIPLYGVYVLGRIWFFTVLKDQTYYLSKSYDSTDRADLQQIFKLLKSQKEMIMGLVREK
ncbi:MAG: hypothetical protein ACPGVB_03830 [Chitinophagales bacterium]